LIQQLAIEASFDLFDLHVINPQHYPMKTRAKARGMLYVLAGHRG